MSKLFAGIAISPASRDEYNISISLISSALKGSVLHSQLSSSPVNITNLADTARSMMFSTFAEPTPITSYFTSFPPAFPPDQYYEVFHALESAKLIDEFDYPARPLNHGEAYSIALPKRPRKATILLTLDCSSPNHLYAASLSSKGSGCRRVNTIISELSVTLNKDEPIPQAVEKMLTSSEDFKNFPDHVLLIKPLETTPQSQKDGIERLVRAIFPNVPVTTATLHEIAHAAASFSYAKFLLVKTRTLTKHTLPVPVSVATASGAAVPIACSSLPLAIKLFVTLTNSVDNQKSATVCFLLGNHKQAKNNLPTSVVVLDGLKPLPRGEARIRVFFTVLPWNGWREVAEIVIEQEDGPQKAFLFPRFFADLPENSGKYEIRVKEEYGVYWTPNDHNILGQLPE